MVLLSVPVGAFDSLKVADDFVLETERVIKRGTKPTDIFPDGINIRVQSSDNGIDWEDCSNGNETRDHQRQAVE